MTFGPPPGPAPAPPPSRSSFDARGVHPFDCAILAAGPLAFVLSFVNFYTESIHSAGSCFGFGAEAIGSVSAWHGFFGWFAVLLALAGSAAAAASIFRLRADLSAPVRLAGLGAYALAVLCILLALLITPGNRHHQRLAGCRITLAVGHGVGYWLTLIVIASGSVLSYLRFRQTGGHLPGAIAGS